MHENAGRAAAGARQARQERGGRMRALITGGAGFIGSHLCERLLADGHEVVVIDDLSTGCLGNVKPLATDRRFRLVVASITNEMVLDRLVYESDIVFHLAAAVGVQKIVSDPVSTIETNVMGSEVLLRTAARYQKKVLLASTSEIYGRGVAEQFSEDDDRLLGPVTCSRWSYACSKTLDEFLALAYARQKQLPAVIARLFNTVGPRQTGRYGMVVPRFVRSALRNESLTVYGDGQQSRCFCHVEDVVQALVGLAGTAAAEGEIFNVGSTEEITIHALAERVILLTGSGSDIVQIPYHEAYEEGFDDMRRRKPNTGKIHKLLGWTAKRSLNEILRSVIAYERVSMQSGGGEL